MTTCRSNRFSCFFFSLFFQYEGYRPGPFDHIDVGASVIEAFFSGVSAGVIAPGVCETGVAAVLRLNFRLPKWTDIGQSRANWKDDRNIATHCAEISWFAARADIKLNSPAMTAAQMILARRRALAPGSVG